MLFHGLRCRSIHRSVSALASSPSRSNHRRAIIISRTISAKSKTLSPFVFQTTDSYSPPRRWFASTVEEVTTEEAPPTVEEEKTEVPVDTEPSEETVPLETEEANTFKSELDFNLRPSQVVAELDRHIIGQQDAKRAVAIAMRNRWRRKQLNDELRKEVTPRNVLLVGPTGCGKTEVARRLANLHEAPFLKVEATKFTEVGYHGRDVDQIIRDLMDVSMQLTRKVWTEKLREDAKNKVEDRILDMLAGPEPSTLRDEKVQKSSAVHGRENLRNMLRQGALDDYEIDVDVPTGGAASNNAASSDLTGVEEGPNFAAFSAALLSRMSAGQSGKKHATERKKVQISEAREIILQSEISKMLEDVDLKKEAITAAEESGIVFIDEIDKICTSRDSFSHRSADASADGVQRDLLPLIEGTTISTKWGNVRTDYILFVASGAFHAVKPSDLLPELQGRLPIRVELKALNENDLYRILTEPVANLIRQQVELIGTEGVRLVFDDDAVREIARMAAELNKTVENIGARRLHTVMERIMEELSFRAAEVESGTVLKVDKEMVTTRLSDVIQKSDMSKYIL